MNWETHLSRVAVAVLGGCAALGLVRTALGYDECPYFMTAFPPSCRTEGPPGFPCTSYTVCPGGPSCLGGDTPSPLAGCGDPTVEYVPGTIYINGTATGGCCTGGTASQSVLCPVFGYFNPISCDTGGGED